MDSKTSEIFHLVDEFCKEFYKAGEGHVLTQTTVKKTKNMKFALSHSEVINIMILFHQKQYRNFNFISNLISGMIAYFFSQRNPHLTSK